MEYKLPDRKPDYEINKPNALTMLSPGMQAVIDYQTANTKDAFVTDCSWEEMRRKYIEERKFWNEGGHQAARIEELKLPGPMGDIPVRIYYPDHQPQHHAVVFTHGGGFTVGSNDTHDRMMRCVMESSGCAVIGVDYTLSPEAKFPIPVFETATVVRYFQEEGAKYGILPDHMALCGDSGGANLAFATNLYLRDTPGGNEFISALLLYYGLYGLEDSTSARLYGNEADGMRRVDLAYYINCYLEKPEDKVNPYFSVLSNDLTYGIPSTYLCCGSLDPLLDDSYTLQRLLQAQGVETEMEEVPGVLHAFMHYGRMMDEARDCLSHSGVFFKHILSKEGL